MRRIHIVMLIVTFLIFLPEGLAKQGHLKLLAVKETEFGYEGSTANLYLEIKQGNGRVFLDTFPLTKVDTQISTRFAKDIACDYLDIDCSIYDFFYTITADSSIIGGPSAGSAITILTLSMLKNLKINEDIAITGTINSGGVIGPIGGVKAKIDAAKSSGIKKVIIPVGERFIKKDELTNKTLNKTIDLVEYGKNLGIEVIETADLDEAIWVYTGQRIKKPSENIQIDGLYSNTMKTLSHGLCNRTKYLISLVNKTELELLSQNPTNITNITLDNANELVNKGLSAFNKSMYYSAGSYCFGANVRLSYIILANQNLSGQSIQKIINTLQKSIDGINKKLSITEIKTISDLESFMAVKERVVEAQELLERAKLSINNVERLYTMSFASERINSAIAWLSFLDNRGREFDFKPELLENSCKKRLSEVEELFQYITAIVPVDIRGIRADIDSVYTDIGDENYVLCLFKASKARAEINVLISSFSLDESQIDGFINQKLKIIKRNIAEESKNSIFPILGYSYYEYADSLKDSDKYSALLYSEYALELSNLEIYFKERFKHLPYFDSDMFMLIIIVALTFILGIIVGKRYKKRRIRKKKATNP